MQLEGHDIGSVLSSPLPAELGREFSRLAHQVTLPKQGEIAEEKELLPGKLLIGHFDATLDQKGRVFIPVALLNSDSYVLTLGERQELWIFPQTEFRRILSELTTAPTVSDSAISLLAAFSLRSKEQNVDGNGRILVPKELRDAAGLSGTTAAQKVHLVGCGNLIELWPDSRFDEFLSRITPGDLGNRQPH